MAESLAVQMLNNKWNQVQAQQGFLGKAWNGVKEALNVGQSASDCESMLEKYNNHEITLEEAMDYIESFEKKQADATNLISNITTGIAAIALSTSVLGVGTKIVWAKAIKYGAPIGAAVKTFLKGADRATNDVEGDTLNAKEIIKDFLSGAVTGTTSAVSSGVYAGVKNASLSKSVINGTLCGVECGALSGSSNYLIDTSLDKDKKFKFDELAKNTLTSSFVSGTVGALVGGGIYGIEDMAGNIGKDIALSTGKTITRDSISSSSRKIFGNIERHLFGI